MHHVISLQDYLLEGLSSNGDAKDLIDQGLDEQNFLQLEVYYEELNFERITESPAYTVNLRQQGIVINNF